MPLLPPPPLVGMRLAPPPGPVHDPVTAPSAESTLLVSARVALVVAPALLLVALPLAAVHLLPPLPEALVTLTPGAAPPVPAVLALEPPRPAAPPDLEAALERGATRVVPLPPASVPLPPARPGLLVPDAPRARPPLVRLSADEAPGPLPPPAGKPVAPLAAMPLVTLPLAPVVTKPALPPALVAEPPGLGPVHDAVLARSVPPAVPPPRLHRPTLGGAALLVTQPLVLVVLLPPQPRGLVPDAPGPAPPPPLELPGLGAVAASVPVAAGPPPLLGVLAEAQDAAPVDLLDAFPEGPVPDPPRPRVPPPRRAPAVGPELAAVLTITPAAVGL
mmetsp:Transcript_27472/g.53586  ORF Transcript_27472/g.53586 Transcript_27472/m.53586 type:complete len:332 (-) Transcript_27472:900-1895(-)